MSTDWANVETLYTILPPPTPCPVCGDPGKPTIVRTEDQGDGTLLRKCICKNCSTPFKVVAEPIGTDE